MARSKKNQKKMIIAISLGLVATMGVFSMMNSQKASLEASMAQQQAAALATMQSQAPAVTPQDELTNTILAKTDIAAGEVITINKIEKKEYKKSELPPNFFFNENFVLGKTASQDIFAGKIITGDDILAASENSIKIPPGMRAITIPTSLIQGLASYIYIGSKIDLLAVKSPPEFIAQNIKIIALETVVDPATEAAAAAAAAAPAAPAAPTAASPAAPAAPAAPAVPVATDTTAAQATIPTSKKNISADKATGITVLVPISIAQKVIDAMMVGKLQVLTRGNNDDKIYRQSSFIHRNSERSISKLPPPPSGMGKLPSLPGVISTVPEQPKVEVEIISGSSKSTQSFDDSNNTQASLPSKNLKDLLKLSN